MLHILNWNHLHHQLKKIGVFIRGKHHVWNIKIAQNLKFIFSWQHSPNKFFFLCSILSEKLKNRKTLLKLSHLLPRNCSYVTTKFDIALYLKICWVWYIISIISFTFGKIFPEVENTIQYQESDRLKVKIY